MDNVTLFLTTDCEMKLLCVNKAFVSLSMKDLKGNSIQRMCSGDQVKVYVIWEKCFTEQE